MLNIKTASILPFEGKPWFSIRNQTAESADLYLYDEIGFWGDNGNTIVSQIKGLEVGILNVFINSPGGSVFDGVTIYNVLARHKAKVNVMVDGLAASIASVIAMAGDTIRMAENAMLMIHDPWTISMGSSGDLRKDADALDQIRETIVTTYAARTKQSREDLSAWMAEETWLDAATAEKRGFVDEVVPAKRAAASLVASFDLSAFRKVPDSLSLQSEKPTPKSLLLRRQAFFENTINTD